jgi:hypothetical protein
VNHHLTSLLTETVLQEETFWEAAKKLIESCIINIRKLQICALDKNFFDQSSAILR